MTTQDKVVAQATMISCSTGTEAEERVLGRQAEGWGFNGKDGKRRFREIVQKKVEIDATDNRTLQTKVERRPRSDKLEGNEIFEKIFEANTDQVKGKRGMRRKYVGCVVKKVGGTRRVQALYDEHPAGIRSMSLEEMRTIMLSSSYYKEWKAKPENAKIVARLAKLGDGDISIKMLQQNEPYWSIKVGMGKCACHSHTGLQYACKALTLWRKLLHANCTCDCANCGGAPDSDEHKRFFASTADCSALGDLVSCAREAETNIRQLNCAATNHFGGNWDAQGGQQCRRCYRSEKDAAAATGTGQILPRARDCMELLEKEMSQTAKMKRATAGGKAPENKDYTIHRRFFRCWDKENPIPREDKLGQKESSAIPGTLSHYCYGAISTAGKMQLRQYSCYCFYCRTKQYKKCPWREVVRSRKHEPKKAGAARTRWLEEGWVEYTMKLKADADMRQLREISQERRLGFVKGLAAGDVIGVYCGKKGGGEVDHTFFWLARVQQKTRTNAMEGDSPVPFRADKDDPGWDIAQGEWILNIRWLKRVRAKVWIEASEQTITLTSVLPLRVVWAKTTTNQYTLSDTQHEELLHMCSTLDEAGLVSFLDWSSLLGVWRESGILDDEEDADLGVIVPDGMNESAVAGLLEKAFLNQPYTLESDPGKVFLVPEYSRLHLDLYLVKREGDSVIPAWEAPTRTDSHAAAVHARPFTGIAQLQEWPVPANTQAYLESLYGYIGTGAVYDEATMLYVRAPAGNVFMEHLSSFWYRLTRDIYFVVIMLPLSENFRKTVEYYTEDLVTQAITRTCGGISLRDCFS
eukprot:g947.t1